MKTVPASGVKDLERGMAGAKETSDNDAAEYACPMLTPECIGEADPGVETTTCKAGADARGPAGGRLRLGDRELRTKRDCWCGLAGGTGDACTVSTSLLVTEGLLSMVSTQTGNLTYKLQASRCLS